MGESATTQEGSLLWTLVGIGLYYSQGYFKQRVDLAGWQQEDYIEVNSRLLPIHAAVSAGGQPVTVAIETRTSTIAARVWKLSVGRNTVLLLDSDVDGNQPEDRDLTARLYGGLQFGSGHVCTGQASNPQCIQAGCQVRCLVTRKTG